MNSILVLSASWSVLLLLVALLSRFKGQSHSMKDRFLRLTAVSAAVLCMGQGMGIGWLYYLASAVMVLSWIMYIRKCDKRLHCIILLAVALICAAADSSLCTWCIAASIIVMYISGLLDKISSDELTGLNNRRELDRYLAGMLSSVNSQDMVFAAMIDIDGFKRINDTEGHSAGDKMLKKYADELKEVCGRLPGRPFLARYGGDEFVISGIGYTDDDIRCLTELVGGLEPKASLGIEYGKAEDYSSAVDLINRADSLMYRNKRRKTL